MQEYTIEIAKLQNKDYHFAWRGNDNFFKEFEETLVERGDFEVQMHLQKTDALLQLQFNIQGDLELICDRSLEVFRYPFQTQGKQILQFADHNEVLDDEFELITKGTAQINVAQYIYELIMLAIPMKKLHPRFQETENTEDLKLVYSSETIDKLKTEQQEKLQEIDPRWAELKKLLEK
ncbi:MAG: DUF177 domain-containing protein [Raineya sp.]|nr:DUF177 domain-containing protein [Raineya sp.]